MRVRLHSSAHPAAHPDSFICIHLHSSAQSAQFCARLRAAACSCVQLHVHLRSSTLFCTVCTVLHTPLHTPIRSSSFIYTVLHSSARSCVQLRAAACSCVQLRAVACNYTFIFVHLHSSAQFAQFCTRLHSPAQFCTVDSSAHGFVHLNSAVLHS